MQQEKALFFTQKIPIAYQAIALCSAAITVEKIFGIFSRNISVQTHQFAIFLKQRKPSAPATRPCLCTDDFKEQTWLINWNRWGFLMRVAEKSKTA
jgi:hypothetical protein